MSTRIFFCLVSVWEIDVILTLHRDLYYVCSQDDGMLKRTMDDGSDVVVPLDDVALTTGSAEGQEVVASKAEAEEARSAENERAVVDDDDEK